MCDKVNRWFSRPFVIKGCHLSTIWAAQTNILDAAKIGI